MKIIMKVLLANLLMLPLTLYADSFSSLWRQYDVSQQKDLPKSSIHILQKIAHKAENEHAYGHLLKAEFLTSKLMTSISPDSLENQIKDLVDRMHHAEETNPTLAAVYQSALGIVYRENNQLDANSKALSKEFFRQSILNPDLLASHKALEYQPLVIQGIDSKIFNDDLLHVLGMEGGAYQMLHDYYEAHGNRSAACICALLATRQKCKDGVMQVKKSKYLLTIDSLISEYHDLSVAGELAIERFNFMEESDDATAESKMNYINYALLHWGTWPRMNILRNTQNRLILPNFHVSVGQDVQIPNKERQVVIMQICNIQQLTLSVWPVRLKGDTKLSPDDPKDLVEIKSKITSNTPVFTETKKYIGLPNYQLTRDTVTIGGLPMGVYLVEFSTDNKTIKPQQMLLRVSDVYVMSQQLPHNQIRLVAVSATTGQPIPGAKIRLKTSNDFDQPGKTETLVCNEKGEVIYSFEKRADLLIYPYTDTDLYCAEGYLNSYGSFPTIGVVQQTKMDILTDRSIYRPGQTVHASAIVYRQDNHDKTPVVSGHHLTLTLRDANYKEVETKYLITDDFGTASADFVLPSTGLTGNYTLRSENGSTAIRSFSVEEYKRPTFQISFDDVKQKYVVGDTVKVVGHVKSFAGIPVQGAKVGYTVSRRPALWRNVKRNREGSVILDTDTLLTDNEGKFVVPVRMLMAENIHEKENRFYSFDVHTDITDVAGESHFADISLPLSDKPTALTCNLPSQILTDSLKTVTFNYYNNAGQPIEGQVKYTIDGHSYTAKANEPTAQGWKNLPSAEHHLSAVCGSDTLNMNFVTFTFEDRKPVVNTSDFFYVSESYFPTDQKPVRLLFGSSDPDIHVVYTLIAGDRIIESGTLKLSDELIQKDFIYQPQYGTGLLMNYAWVKDGKMYHHQVFIGKPKRDNQLKVEWKTFRDRLTPGQQEEWTLRVKQPDGKPAKAQLMAVLFDKTLNEIKPHDWYLSTLYYPALPWTTWNGLNFNTSTLYGDAPINFLKEPVLDFSHLDNTLMDNQIQRQIQLMTRGGIKRYDVVEQMSMAAKEKMPDAADLNEMVVAGNGKQKKAELTGTSDSEEQRENSKESGSQGIRQNFNETAFFYPALLAEKDGQVKIKFTLPESVTTWQFMGLAHDQEMNYGMLKDEIVAQKTVMVQLNVPRFVRSGDQSEIVSRLFNSSDKKVLGTAVFELIDPETEKIVFTQKQSFSLDPKSTGSAKFCFNVSNIVSVKNDLSLLIVRVTANGSGYQDGEQYYLPILPDKELITTTVPFTQSGPSVKSIDVASLFPVKESTNKLTIEYTNNPTWLMIQALPAISQVYDDNAISLAAAYYATGIGRNILLGSPAIASTIRQWKQEKTEESSLMSNLEKNQSLKTMVLEETPWVMDGQKESDQKRQLINFFDENTMNYRMSNFLQKLTLLQNPDGSFSWWSGMGGSRYMTTEVTKMLVRLNSLVGNQQPTTQLLSRAFQYLDKKAADEVVELKRLKAKGEKNLVPSETACDYLYINSLAGRPVTTNIHYLVSLLSSIPNKLTIYGKANTALVLSMYGKMDEAKEYLKSISEYSVYKEEMGRYFDTPKAQYSWCDYRIPSQVAVIEACKQLLPGDKRIEEMQRWLLQSKRTQAWDTPINSVNAVYAFLHEATNVLQPMGTLSTFKLDNMSVELPKATAGLGYVKTAKTGKDLKTLVIDKKSDGISWGAVYAQFIQKSTDVGEQSSGLKVTRQVLHNGKPAEGLKIGDKVKIILTIEADRDYDFVQLQDKRAACLEPLTQLSGYHGGYYCSPKDNVTNYFFNYLSKGKHVVETEYYIDRAGFYQTGICVVQCAYSPEYNGRAAANTLTIK